MHLLLPTFFLLATFALLSPTQAAVPPPPPAAPALSYLYTALVDCTPRIFTAQTPHGLRTAIPIVGGNFTGPRLSGRILDLGADWGTTDPATGIFTADTRYDLQTDDGADIFIQTSGPKQVDGTLHLRLVFETGAGRYYWLNNVVGELIPLVDWPGL
ncbi:putative scytalone dehydratase [Diplodia seriata]|uniref:Putative scytalone dehydratase n=1 Tax=Diplodia seriata TaxID=420778 RepID=A0A0G2GYD4_9PEZI|nr:putative scytalone dehydratase [Diplodia seriata]